jgi:AmmeMemoRadiSam system protein B
LAYKPILRGLDFQPVTYQEQPMWLIRDPLQLTEHQLVMPAALAQMLMFCDGTRTPEEIHAAFCAVVGGKVDYDVVTNALDQLDAACLLDNERSRKTQQAVLDSYRALPHRLPALANLGYPGNVEQLLHRFQQYGEGDDLKSWTDWYGRGIVSPHIDYQRGGPVYAKVWHRAKAAVLEAELVLIFGTDHNGSPGSITLTQQPYATPFGVLPSDPDLIEKLAQAIDPRAAFAQELHHRSEHSVELSAVWLHYIYHQANKLPSPMVPILCGSFHHFLMNGSHPAEDDRLMRAIDTLRQETAGKRVLAVASVDLAHVGPSFGDDFTMDASRRATLSQSDGKLIQAILNGNPESFYDQISAIQDRYRICGFSSIYLMLYYLGLTEGVSVAYEQCAADPQDTSLVSICGLLLT